jgi:hypothetical protein
VVALDLFTMRRPDLTAQRLHYLQVDLHLQWEVLTPRMRGTSAMPGLWSGHDIKTTMRSRL